jgi:hypothetical protein
MRATGVKTRLTEWIMRMLDDGLLEPSGGDFPQERRQHPRYRPTKMKWRLEVTEEHLEGELETISVGGACIRCQSRRLPPEPGDRITVTFERSGPDPLVAEVIAITGSVDGYMLHLSWSLDQDHAVERVNGLLAYASR